ncbi:response regulator RpfG family c-di-GMP phosphodiesterase [Actinoplanes tereljensis]|uniref:Response regulator n=1 Tax=Paractinoplanes tereljensis TaxID=571912 RepID=A0A919NMD4_9ACTN|nr:response regulator [Actinoplanes tereljensis]GIF20477.1 response regulator [Actinoplanes tereljensis]
MVNEHGRPTVLLVDDENEILEALALQLRRDHKVLTAASGDDALRVLAETGPVAAVISDLRMPGMDGVELLRRVQLEYPDTTRVLHTAQSDLSAAISAINDGGVYRYLAKPVKSDELRATVQDAVELNGRTTTERHLLDTTLKSSIQAVFGCLELASPAAFARAGRIRTRVSELCVTMQLEALWEIEVAAMASQLGAVTIPPSVLAKLDKGLPCTEEEQHMIDAMPGVAVELLKGIPMMEDVLEIVRGLAPGRVKDPSKPQSPLIEAAIDVIRTAMDFETLESRGMELESAITVLECRDHSALNVLSALREVNGLDKVAEKQVRGLKVAELEVGMRVAEDIAATNGLVLIGRGMTVTSLLLDRLDNYARMIEIIEPVLAIPGALNPLEVADSDLNG